MKDRCRRSSDNLVKVKKCKPRLVDRFTQDKQFADSLIKWVRELAKNLKEEVRK